MADPNSWEGGEGEEEGVLEQHFIKRIVIHKNFCLVII